jgi:hypothetical protein
VRGTLAGLDEGVPVAIDEAERAQILDEVGVSTALEGGRASAPVETMQDEWVAGRITLDELGAAVRRMYPSTND